METKTLQEEPGLGLSHAELFLDIADERTTTLSLLKQALLEKNMEKIIELAEKLCGLKE